MVVQDDVQAVRVGSRVRLQDLDGEADYSLVPAEEADPFMGLVSAESPLGRALQGRSVGDRVAVYAPGGVHEVTVLSISPIS